MSSGQAWCADPANAEALREAEIELKKREETRRDLLDALTLDDITDGEIVRLFNRARAAVGYTLRRDQMRHLAAVLDAIGKEPPR